MPAAETLPPVVVWVLGEDAGPFARDSAIAREAVVATWQVITCLLRSFHRPTVNSKSHRTSGFWSASFPKLEQPPMGRFKLITRLPRGQISQQPLQAIHQHQSPAPDLDGFDLAALEPAV